MSCMYSIAFWHALVPLKWLLLVNKTFDGLHTQFRCEWIDKFKTALTGLNFYWSFNFL